MPPFCFQIKSTGKIALVTADDEDCGEKNTGKEAAFRHKQCKKDADADPEHDKTDCFSHKNQ